MSICFRLLHGQPLAVNSLLGSVLSNMHDIANPEITSWQDQHGMKVTQLSDVMIMSNLIVNCCYAMNVILQPASLRQLHQPWGMSNMCSGCLSLPQVKEGA